MGRGKDIFKIKAAAKKSRVNQAKAEKRTKPFQGNKDDFIAMLRQRGLSEKDIEAAVTSKFGFR